MDSLSSGTDVLTIAAAIVVAAYLCIIFFRQGLRYQGDIRAVYMVASLFFLPVLLVAFSVYGGRNLLDAFDRDRLDLRDGNASNLEVVLVQG